MKNEIKKNLKFWPLLGFKPENYGLQFVQHVTTLKGSSEVSNLPLI